VSALAARVWPEFASDSEPRVLALPVGATEQHGPHLPLSTDTDIAVALAQGLAAAVPSVEVAPPLAYASSGEHSAFPGTISIGQDALELTLVELGRSASATFQRMLLICGHGGNAEPVGRAVARLRAEGRDARAWAPCWRGDAHAGRVETSLMLALAPHLVRVGDAEAGNREPLAAVLTKLRREGVAAVSANGVLGDPHGASADEGRALLRDTVAELVAVLRSWTAAEEVVR
jgi:creatinine amidohydrolase